MNKKYLVENIVKGSYLQNRGKWTKQPLLSTLFDTVGEAEDELEKFINASKIVKITPVYINE